MFEFFEKVGVTYATRNQINELIDRIVLHLTNNGKHICALVVYCVVCYMEIFRFNNRYAFINNY